MLMFYSSPRFLPHTASCALIGYSCQQLNIQPARNVGGGICLCRFSIIQYELSRLWLFRRLQPKHLREGGGSNMSANLTSSVFEEFTPGVTSDCQSKVDLAPI